MGGLDHDPARGGFFVNYAAAGLVLMILIAGAGFFITDHTELGRLEDRMDEIRVRLADIAQVSRLVDHIEGMEDHFKRVETHLDHSDKIDEESAKDRTDLKYRMSRVEDAIKIVVNPGLGGNR